MLKMATTFAGLVRMDSNKGAPNRNLLQEIQLLRERFATIQADVEDRTIAISILD